MAASPRAYHHGDLRAALLREGHRYLVEVGPEEISLRELARRTNVSPRAPYRHFANREALLGALAAEGYQLLLEDFSEADGLEPRERLQDMGRAYVQFARNNPSVFQLMFSTLINQPEVERYSGLAFEKLLKACAPLLPSTTSAKGRATFATAIWAGLHGIATINNDGVGQIYESDAFVSPEDLIEAISKGWEVKND